jgi:predicted component of type VI protein secretion system
MSAELEVLSANARGRIVLEGDRATVGKAAENDVVLDDAQVSHMHAVFERFPAGWCIRDLGSSNGTWLNGSRIWAQQRVRSGDDIRIGQTRLLFHDRTAHQPLTEMEEAAPLMTAREHDVLVALCRPLLARDMFTEPAPTRAIATDLVVSEAAVKQHLAHLFAKFGIGPDDDRRRLRLANEAIRRGAVSIADLRAGETD